MNNKEVLDKLHHISFNIGETTTTRGGDCLSDKLNIEDFTYNPNMFFTDNWLPILLKDIPGKYVWIGYRFGRGRSINKYLPEMRKIARQIPGGIVYDFTDTTNMLFVFIPDED